MVVCGCALAGGPPFRRPSGDLIYSGVAWNRARQP